MNCQNCEENEATVFLTEIENKKKVEFRLCESCASQRNKNSAIKQMPIDMNAPDSGTITSSLAPLKALPDSAEPCPSCGLTLTTFRTTGRVGCALCYEHFKVYLVSLIERIHKSSQHVGKVPTKTPEPKLEDMRRKNLDQLVKEQQRCISEEKYERAAEIRDLITDLENQAPQA